MKNLCRVFGLVTVSTLLFCLTGETAENPKERIDFWQKNYEELQPDQDPHAKNAHEIFNRLLSTAGKRPGVVPRLFIVKSDSPYIPLAFALPDGGIIISKRVLDICYKDPERGSDRLAFVLAHEIAHQLKDDFWHLKFFQAVDLSKEKGLQQEGILKEVREIASLTDKVLAKELQADEYGIIYSSMAGFNTSAIVTEDYKVNFFEYFYQSLDPGNAKAVQKDSTHPTPRQRAETVRARLKQVLEKVELFNLGVLFYQSGDYQRAILFFGEFLRFFPGREVYHNLASSHHQLALKYYQEWKEDKKAIPFKLSIAADPETRASKITLRGGMRRNPEDLFKEHIEKAVEYYQAAIAQDPSYILSYSNLACALIVKEKDNVNKAVGLLKDALKIRPNPWEKEVLNNLGVALYLDEKPNKAKEYLLKAHQMDGNYEAPLFNLGKIAFEEKDEAEKKKYWTAYLKLDSFSAWADIVRTALLLESGGALIFSAEDKPENIMGLEAGDSGGNISSGTGKVERISEFPIEEDPFKVTVYKGGVMILSQKMDILMVAALGEYSGKSMRGISIGSTENDVLAKYGRPTRILNNAGGLSLIYKEQKIVFGIRQGKVASWMLF